MSQHTRDGLGLQVRQIMNMAKPQIDITLTGSENASTSYIRSYSTMDRIEGFATIHAKSTVDFDSLDISMLGMTKTYVDKMTTMSTMHGRTEATHRFLKLTQPLREADLPPHHRLEKGQDYTIPFTFVVPPYLLPKACSHRCVNQHVKEAHLQLPPSMGDPDISGFGPHLLDDLCPAMVKILYSIRVNVTKIRDDGTVHVVAEGSKKLRIKPAFEEKAPLSVEPGDEEYNLSEQKTIRKGVLKGKLGKLTVKAAQPPSFRLPTLTSNQDPSQVSTMVKLRLRFDPHDQDSKPPQLGSLHSKIKASTFFATAPRADIPKKSTAIPDMSQGYISESMNLSNMCVANAEWVMHAPGSDDLERRTSTVSANTDLSSTSSSSSARSASPPAAPTSRSTSGPSSSQRGLPFYTATLVVPLNLPTSKNFLPTFHTCTASRIYSLSLSLSLHKTSLLSSTTTLKIPVQISAAGSAAAEERLAQAEAEVVALLEAEQLFVPRTGSMAVGAVTSSGQSDEPPAYGGAEFHGGAAASAGGGFGRAVGAGVAVC